MNSNVPTALSSMMPWALVVAADMAAGVTLEPKNLRKKEMLGNKLRSERKDCLWLGCDNGGGLRIIYAISTLCDYFRGFLIMRNTPSG